MPQTGDRKKLTGFLLSRIVNVNLKERNGARARGKYSVLNFGSAKVLRAARALASPLTHFLCGGLRFVARLETTESFFLLACEKYPGLLY